MVKGMKVLMTLGMATFLSASLISCQGSMNTKVANALPDSALVEGWEDGLKKEEAIGHKDTVGREMLAKRLKEPIYIPVDTLSPLRKDSLEIWIKNEKRRIRDSVRLALDKFPKHIYFTFDDGPLLGSAAIDSISRAKNVKINVFLVGKHAYMSKALKRDFELYYNNPLVECYNHSYTHANNRFTTFYSNPISAYDDFEKNEVELKLKHKIIRLPGRNIWIYDDVRRVDLQSGASTADMLYTNGYRIFGWDVEWKIHGLTGKPIQSVDEIYTRIRNYMDNKSSMEPNNVVLLMHDDMFRNKKGQQLLSTLIDTIQRNTNYTFEFMRNYPFRY